MSSFAPKIIFLLFKVIGLTRLGIKPKSTAQETDAPYHTTLPSELLKNQVKTKSSEDQKKITLEMVWAAKRTTNEPLTGLFIGSLTAQFYLLLLTGPPTSRYQFLKSLSIFIIP